MRRIHAARSVVTDELLPEFDYVGGGQISPHDFDGDENWGPGAYSWIDVDDDVAAGWDAGLDACEAAGVDPLSRAGIELRWRAIHGDAPVSERLLAWVERHEQRLAAEEEDRRAREADAARYEQILRGYENLGHHNAEIWGPPRPTGTELVFRGVAGAGDSQRTLIQADEVTIIEELGLSYNWWTRDPQMIAEARKRKAIRGYLYPLPLARVLAELERTRPPSVVSWIGSYGLEKFERTGWEGAYSECDNRTADELVARLRAYLVERAEKDLTHEDLIRRALELAVDGCIVATSWRWEIVGIPEIAEKLGVKRATVDVWRQRDVGFPEPTHTVGGRPAWIWSDVAAWAYHTGRLPESAL